MSKKSIERTLAYVDALPDEDIDYSDCPELDENDPGLIRVANPWFLQALKNPPEPKQPVTLKLDADLLRWLKSQGKGYQTRINALLRQYMEQQLQHQG